MAQTDGLLTPGEVATRLRTTTDTVRRWARDGRIEYVRLPGGHVRIPSAEVDRLLVPAQHPPQEGDELVADAG